MSIKYDQKSGKLFQTNIMVSALKKEGLLNVAGEKAIALKDADCVVNIFDIAISDAEREE